MNTILIFIFIIIICLGAGLAIAISFSRIQKAHYDPKNNQAILEGLRDSIEKQIYGLNDRLIQNEERWKDVNHLLHKGAYVENKSPITNSRRTYHSDFLKANGITENDLIIDPKLIFILTPFNDKYYEDYKTIREACSSLGYKCFRGDEHFIKGDIFPEMLKLIVKAKLIIANINGRSPNVLYELGITQALDKPVLLISQDSNNLPVDIKSKQFLFFKNHEELQDLIKQELRNITVNVNE